MLRVSSILIIFVKTSSVMKRTFILFSLLFLSLGAHAQEQFHPLADAKSQVVAGKARFTILMPQLIRMEWAEDGVFEDRATLGVVNRCLPVPAFRVRKHGEGVTIKTESVTLTYKGGPFDEKSLKVEFLLNGKKQVWYPGLSAEGNLLGTTRTLDKFDGEKYRDDWDYGVCSRDGWAVLDESERQVFTPVEEDWNYWVDERPEGERIDWYLFAYGHDYKQAVSDFTQVSGRIPLPPKWSLGYWWCRYWQYSDFEFIDLGRQIRDLSIPIDVMVLDMDWHETWGLRRKNTPKDEFGERIGWTGYTWNSRLFPSPENFLQDLHDMGLKTTLNLHPASGIQPYEEPYRRFVSDYLSRTDDYDGPEGFVLDGKEVPVPFRIDQMAWADAYFNSVIRPMERQGVDFWWLDWQQWRESKYIPGLSNTFWLNYTFYNDMARTDRDRRPMIYHRWGGIGSHRYQIGFSGDTYATWKVLGRLPWFTATASNVGYGYWGHDIGGHMQPKGVSETDPELYTRWLQEGVFTPIFKTHSTKDQTMEKRFWVFPEYFDAMREAIRLRYSLSPYIYGAARETYDTGISMCRPLYYEYPEAENAYTWDQEFLFGPDILATVIDCPADKVTGLARRRMWFPEGDDWYDVSAGTLLKGGSEWELSYTKDENPWYIRAGAIIPMAPEHITSLQEPLGEFVVFVAPGDGKSEAFLYEDDGVSKAYEHDFARTRLEKTASERDVTVRIHARKGSYEGMSPLRKVRVVLDRVFPPTAVLVDGKEVPYSRFPAKETGPVWTYVGKNLALEVWLPGASADAPVVVECCFDPVLDQALLQGKKGLIQRMMRLTPEFKMELGRKDNLKSLPDEFVSVAQAGSIMTEYPSQVESALRAIDTGQMLLQLEKYGFPEKFMAKLAAQCQFADSGEHTGRP